MDAFRCASTAACSLTDVVVRPYDAVILSAQTMLILFKEGEVVTTEEIKVSAKKDVQMLDEFVVTNDRPPAFTDANVDTPRTMNDAN